MWPITIVVPCYNEAQRLNLAEFERFVRAAPGHRLVMVNDGSSDDTGRLLAELAGRNRPQVSLVDLPENQGKAEAVRRGMLHALRQEADYVGYWDADLATPLDAVGQFCAVLNRRDDIDVVVGSRLLLSGRRIRRRGSRRLAGGVFARAAKMLMRVRLRDTQCGAKLFRATPELAWVFGEPFSARWVFDVEILARLMICRRTSNDARRLEEALYELPLDEWHDVAGSKLRPSDFARAAGELLRIFWRYRLQGDFQTAPRKAFEGPEPNVVSMGDACRREHDAPAVRRPGRMSDVA